MGSWSLNHYLEVSFLPPCLPSPPRQLMTFHSDRQTDDSILPPLCRCQRDDKREERKMRWRDEELSGIWQHAVGKEHSREDGRCGGKQTGRKAVFVCHSEAAWIVLSAHRNNNLCHINLLPALTSDTTHQQDHCLWGQLCLYFWFHHWIFPSQLLRWSMQHLQHLFYFYIYKQLQIPFIHLLSYLHSTQWCCLAWWYLKTLEQYRN